MNLMTATFESLNLEPFIMKAIEKMGFEEPTPVQVETIPLIMAGRDVMAQAQTGTGKTAAFGIPLLQKITCGRMPSALILVPTRELGVQVAGEITRLAEFKKGVSVLPIYGGRSLEEQYRALEKGVDIVVATPGRLMDHMQRRTIDLSQVQFLVLDEADRMLDMGFIEDIDYILSKLPKKRQSMLFSATIPETVRKIAGEHMHDPVRVIVSEDKLVLPSTRQIYFNIERKNKIWALCRVLDKYQPKAMVFAQTKMMVNTIERVLKSYGYPVAALHGDLTQARREKVLTDFRSGKIQILVATDVAARGLDIEDVTHVINFDIPEDPEVYVHRIGRTGRAGKEGVAITFITAREMYLLKKIKEFGVVEMQEEPVPESGQKDVVRRVVDFEAYSDIFGMVKFRISLGEKDHIRSIDIVDILSRRLKVNEMSIGNIVIHDDYTEVEVHKDAAAKALAGLRSMDINGKKLHVDLVPVKNL